VSIATSLAAIATSLAAIATLLAAVAAPAAGIAAPAAGIAAPADGIAAELATVASAFFVPRRMRRPSLPTRRQERGVHCEDLRVLIEAEAQLLADQALASFEGDSAVTGVRRGRDDRHEGVRLIHLGQVDASARRELDLDDVRATFANEPLGLGRRDRQLDRRLCDRVRDDAVILVLSAVLS